MPLALSATELPKKAAQIILLRTLHRFLDRLDRFDRTDRLHRFDWADVWSSVWVHGTPQPDLIGLPIVTY